MKYSVNEGCLFLTAENETDNAILSEIWQRPLIMEYKRNHRQFMDNKGFLPDELITREPKRVEVEG